MVVMVKVVLVVFSIAMAAVEVVLVKMHVFLV
jgi:hypothetical protein